MFTKFHSNTIETKFIQNLINSTNIPLSNVWHTKKFVVVGNSYLTDKGIYKALKTGLWESLTDKYENEPCFEWVGNYVFGQWVDGYTTKCSSNTTYYNAEIHRYLGDYLRAYRDICHIDLMPFYNCFLGEYVSNIDFTFKSVSNNAPKGYKIASIPVRFDTEYQIGLDCSTGIELLCVIYGNKGNIESLTTVLNNESSYNNSSPQQRYKSYVKTVGCSLRHPFAYHTPSWDNGEIPTTDGKLNDLGQYERDLRLLVKIPEGNSSSIVVLEMESKDKKSIQMVSGDYISPRYIEDSIVSESLLSPLSLLQMSNGENYAFSDRLIEYLTLSVIDSKDEISGNIKRTQQYITNQNFIKYNATYRQSDSEQVHLYDDKYTEGVWNESMRKFLFQTGLYSTVCPTRYDLTGYVDKNIEQIITRGQE